MTALTIAGSLLIIFLVLDRIQNMITRRNALKDEQKKAKLDVLRIVTKQELHRSKDAQSFEKWITRFLKMMHYTDIKPNRYKEEDSYDFSCLDQKGHRVYLICKLWNVDQFDTPVHCEDIQKLVGAMVGDRVRKGLIVTSGEISDEAKKYIDILPVTYKIKIIDGEILMEKLHGLRKVNLEPLLE